ncbi:MAG TPA: serine/threonine-protein kinase [Myxococcaceae bacterium]
MDDTTLPTVIVPLTERDVLDGRWTLVRKVAEGASGAVYLAQEQGTERPVAVKILSPLLCRNPKILGRFEREARQLAALNHPNVIKLLAVGRSGAQPFIVMPFIDGTTLAQHVRQKGRLSSEEALAILRQLCAGLGHLHEKGLVHRDVKPGNVMIAVNGHVTLLDLGVVRERGAPPLTAPGARLGTPNYMAPEQIEASHDVDQRADLYSLGAVAFELLTGGPPFRGANMRDLLEQHRVAAPPNAAHLAASVSRATGDVLALALAKSPQERYQSARLFMEALERAMAPLTQRHPRNRLMVSGEDSLSGGQSITQAATVPDAHEDSIEVSGSTLSTAVSASSTAPPTLSSTAPPPTRQPSPATRTMRRATSVLWYAAAGVALGAVALFGLAMARGLSLAELVDPEADGVLEIAAEPGAPPATVLVDGAPQGDTPLRLNLAPGAHRIRLLRPGDPEMERDVTLGPRQEVHLSVPPAR